MLYSMLVISSHRALHYHVNNFRLEIYIYMQDVQVKGIQNKISESIYTHLWVTPLQRETIKIYVWVYNFLAKFQCELPWWHNKHPDDIRPCYVLLEACFVLP
jgi:hypothetical protein